MPGFDLQDRAAVVTGGASGIGEACARMLHRSGARVVIADNNISAAKRIAADLDGLAMMVDVSDEADVARLVEWTETEVGACSILVTSAGLVQPPLAPCELSLDIYDRIIAVNLRGTYLCARGFAERMLPRRSGSIVTISSVTAERSVPLHAYAPTKAAVSNLTMCLAAEWGRAGIRVNSIEPGYVMTPAVREQIDKGHRDPRLLAQNSALGRMIDPDEIAKAVAFLVSDDAAAITGVALPVDAGFLCAGSWAPYGGVRPHGDEQHASS